MLQSSSENTARRGTHAPIVRRCYHQWHFVPAIHFIGQCRAAAGAMVNVHARGKNPLLSTAWVSGCLY